jgi:hypothetical protein
MKRKYMITAVIFTLLSMVFFTVGFVMGDINRRGNNSPGKESKDWTDVGGNVDIEYYLEVSEDSIWIENYNTHRVYGGKYADLDSLILIDNL